MKKLISAVLAAAMAATCGISVFAGEITKDTDPQSDTVEVLTVVSEDDLTYSVEIPADCTIGWGDTASKNMDYHVTTQLPLGAKLTVVVTDSYSGYLQSAAGSNLAYTGTGIGVIGEFGPLVTNQAPQTSITVSIPKWTEVPVTVYQTTLTYTVTYIAAGEATP